MTTTHEHANSHEYNSSKEHCFAPATVKEPPKYIQTMGENQNLFECNNFA